ncbi:MAG: PAS domain S-box protein [Phycisphaeraceae bacterium]|nr:PAS domain S-box protein [Phycisphaeraceae bacterium]MCW5764000.1 PAS domain S-box protein [Phycisphaeraceae bacterium]
MAGEPAEMSTSRGSRRESVSAARLLTVIGVLSVIAAGAAGVLWVWRESGEIAIELIGVCVGGAIAVGVCGARVMQRGRATDAVSSSLRAYAGGVREVACLSVADSLGPIGAAYNALLAERDRIEAIEAAEALARVEGEERSSAEGLQGALDAMWSGVMVFGRDGLLEMMNGAAGVLLGINRSESVGQGVRVVMRDESMASATERVCSGGSRRKEVFELRRGSEESGTWLRVSVKGSQASDGGAVVIVEDVTQQRAAEEARKNLVAHTVHELRTPLTNIRLYVEEAVEAGEDDAKRREQCLNVINQESRRLERVVADMLSMTEIESGSLQLRPGDVRLDAIFEDLRADYEAAATEKGISLSFVLPPKLPVMFGDREKLSVLLHNLLGNATKYTPRGGVVMLEVVEEAGWLIVKVADTGIGIDPSEIERIFERFYRSTDVRLGEIEGTGLGLTLAREVARLHGGDITVESELEKGSTFTVRLPVGQRTAAAA